MTMKALSGHSLARGTVKLQRSTKAPAAAPVINPAVAQRSISSLQAYEQETRPRPTRGGRDDRRGGPSRKGGKAAAADDDDDGGAEEEYTEDIFGRSGSSTTASSSSPASPAPPAQSAPRSFDTAGSSNASSGGYSRGYNSGGSNGERRPYNDRSAATSQGPNTGGYSRGYNSRDSGSGSTSGTGEGAAGGTRQYNGAAGSERPTRQFNGGGERVSRAFNGSSSGGGERREYNGDRPARSYNRDAAAGGQGEEGGERQYNGTAGGRRTTGARPQLRMLSAEQLAVREESNAAVGAATTWRECAAVLEARKDKLDADHLTQLFTKTAKSQPESEADLVEYKALIAALYGWVSACIPGLRPRTVVACLMNVARVRYFNGELVEGLVKRASELMGNLMPYDYSNIINALSSLEYNPGAEWMQQYFNFSRKNLSLMKPFEVSQLLNGLVKLQARPDAEWFATAADVAARQVDQIDNFQWASILYGMAYLGYDGGDGSFLSAFTADPTWVRDLRTEQMYQAVWALTQFEQRPKPEFINALLATFQGKLRRCSNAELSMIAYSLAYLRAQPNPDFLTQLVKIIDMKRSDLSGDELANLVMSLGIWQYQGSAKAVDDLCITIKPKLPSTSLDGLVKYQNGLPLLGNFNRVKMVVSDVEHYIAAQQQMAADAAAAAEQAGAQQQEAPAAAVAAPAAEEEQRTPQLAGTY